MSTDQYDAIIVGAGHNGLVAAAYLAQAHRKVLVLERRPIVGGSVVTESFGDGFLADSVWAGGSLRPAIVSDLKLRLPAADQPAFISLLAGPQQLVLQADPLRAAESIKRFSGTDAAKWPEFIAFMHKAVRFLDGAYATTMPRLPKEFTFEQGYGLLELGLDLRLMGRADMLRVIRGMPMTAEEFVDEWFESDIVKAAIASLGSHGLTLGVMGAGTGFTLMHNWLNRGGLAHPNVGSAGVITAELAQAVRALGGEIRTDAEVQRIVIKNMRATGVVLGSGEEISANQIISAVDPKRTFLSLVGPMELPPEFVWNVQSIKMRGSLAKIHLLTNGSHGLPGGTIVLAPSMQYLERAYDAAKYHEISRQPYLELTTSGNVISIHFQYAPYQLKNGKTATPPSRIADLAASQIETLALDALAEHFPKLKSSIIGRRVLTPADLEDIYGLTEGDLNHGQLLLDQFFFMRPIPGWSNHRTPIDKLYLGGSGVHGGGGVSGAAGRNAARVVLSDKE